MDEKRIYRKRNGPKFALQLGNAIVKSVKEVGLVKAAELHNTLPVYVSALCKSRKVKVSRGRRPSKAA